MTDHSIPGYLSGAMKFYDSTAKKNRAGYLTIKLCQLTGSASLPVIALIHNPAVAVHQAFITGAMGATLLVLEGIQQTMQFQARWTKFRATHNMLQRERNLYESEAGPYRGKFEGEQTPLKLFAERSDSILASENSDWMALQERSMSQSGKN